jgi:hypothetical protein
MNGYEFLAWALGIIFIGLPLAIFGLPCIVAAIMAWRFDR